MLCLFRIHGLGPCLVFTKFNHFENLLPWRLPLLTRNKIFPVPYSTCIYHLLSIPEMQFRLLWMMFCAGDAGIKKNIAQFRIVSNFNFISYDFESIVLRREYFFSEYFSISVSSIGLNLIWILILLFRSNPK